MDRDLSKSEIYKKRNRHWLLGIAAVAAIVIAVYFFKSFLKTSVEAAKIRTSVADTGSIENTLTATGEVIPAFEQIITSPIKASIKRVFFTPGTLLQTGQPIVELDKSITLIELEKLQDQLALKENSIQRLKMDLDKKIYDADVNDQIKSLTINRLRADLEDTKRLQKVGGRTLEDVSKAENNLRIAELEKAQLENELAYNRKSVGANVRESELNAQIESKNLKELSHKLKMANIVADRPGVLTWVNDHIGTSVNEGEMLAKMADLGSFRVEGSCSDIYSDQLILGMPVIIKVNDIQLRGVITQIKPTVENSVVQFSVQLDDDKHASLRPNMKVELFLVTKRVDKTVRVANGPAFSGKRKPFVYVLKDGIARRREVEIGLSNFDYVEIKSGIAAGETVIISDLSRFEHLQEIIIE
jgi:HlyD family secretion protein